MNQPKIVIFDLEIIPDLKQALKVWPRLGSWPGKTLRASVTTICSIGYKVIGDQSATVLNAWDYPNWKKDINDDSELCRQFYDIIKDADAVVTHNGIRFDWKYYQTRILKHGLGPLPKIPNLDTKKIASSELFLFDNKLDTLSDFFLEDKKLDHEGWDLWVAVCEDDPKAKAKMSKYCKQDVELTHRNFTKLKPFFKNIPNYNLFTSVSIARVCANCGSTRLKSNGWRYTKTRAYQRLQCIDCKSWTQLDTKQGSPRSV